MLLLFSADLHGNDTQYARLFAFAAAELVDAVIIGGDIAPKHLSGEQYVAGQRAWYAQLGEHLRRYKTLHPAGEVFVMMGNDDVKCNLAALLSVLREHGAHYLHGQRHSLGDIDIVGYACVPITPFPLKDWELADVTVRSAKAQEMAAQLIQPVSHEGVLSGSIGWVPVALPREPAAQSASIQHDLATPTFTGNARTTVYVMHTPPVLTKLDMISNGMHVGSIAVREFIEERQPLLTLHGHIHETVEVSGDFREQLGESFSYACGNHETTQHVMAILVDTQRPGEGKRIAI